MNRILRAIGAALLALVLFVLAAFGGAERAKYVFLFIGDGIGEAQVIAAELYSVYGGGEPLAFHGLPVRGTMTTASSKAAGTACDGTSPVTTAGLSR